MKIDHDLHIGGSLDPKHVRKTIHGLRLLARLGRRAERDLADLKRDGELLRPTAWLEAGGDNWSNKGLESLSIHVTNSITKHEAVFRDDVPEWNNISIYFSSLRKQKVGPYKVDCFDVFLSGVSMEWNSFTKKMKYHSIGKDASERTGLVGHVRLKKNGHISFSPNYNGWIYHSVMKGPFNMSKARPEKMAKILAESVACNLIKHAHNYEERKMYLAKLSILRRDIPKWLVEDGTAESFVDQIKSWSSSVRVVTDIMEG